MGILLDTTVIIDHFNGISQASEFILAHQHQVFLSVITRAESLAGFEQAHLLSVKNFLNFFPTLPLTVEDADRAAELRRTEKWKLPDAMQAAFAQNHQLKLATRNSKDFSPHKHKFVIIPYHLKN